MAKATKHPAAVPVPPYTVTLELSQEEAEVLRKVTGGIAGNLSGPRRATDQIHRALVAAGVDRPERLSMSPTPTLDTVRTYG